ncbi:cobalamin biosynthesis protein CobD [Ramlibacter sp. RBP-2]|uniref:Cobalamin biosynthesis protein CobD n=2 Tax=Ramlibacter lithotrophicus TaxID=2606681 RepID=A0A7X6I6K2_9BURK|nr:cobalamin biosynthesis protein CobD [Ramlibacter lithotrophicus]
MVVAGALVVAWLLDAAFGEPRNAWHPVAWLGRLLSALGQPLPGWPPPVALAAGAGLWLATAGTIGAAARWLEVTLLEWPAWAGVPLLALALKPTFAWRMLREEVAAVEVALASGLPCARKRLAGLCSRDVGGFDATAVRETALETLAENLNDSVVAPLFWYAVAGLPGAWVWRAVNTMDALWGYHGRWEWAGKCAARADDLLAWLPARITAALLWRPGVQPAALRREAATTPSPNGGWPMAAMALRLGIRLSKPGVYVLHPGGDQARSGHMAQALRAAGHAAALAAALALGVLLWRGAA